MFNYINRTYLFSLRYQPGPNHLIIFMPSPSTPPQPGTHQTLSQASRLAELRKFAGNGLKFILPLGISIGLVIWLFHKVDVHSIEETIRHGCDYRWIVLMMVMA